MAKQKFLVRFAKQLLAGMGVVYFKRPNLVPPGRKPRAFVVTRFLNSTVVSLGRFVWLSGEVSQSSLRARWWPQRINCSAQPDEKTERFVLSSFLNAVVPDEAWLRVPASSNRLDEGDYLVLGTGPQLVDGTGFRSNQYYHFLLQAVPAWLLLEKEEALLLKVQGAKDWQKSVLEALDIPFQLEVPDGPLSSQLVRRKGLNPTKTAVVALRKRLQASIGQPPRLGAVSENQPQPRPRILFINRTASTSLHMERMVSNLAEVEKVLKTIGDVRSEDLGSKSFRDQFNLVNWADVLCGPHGAGLSNISLHLGAKPPGVIELVSERRIPPHFERLSHILGFNFRRVFVSETPQGELFVNPQKLVEAVQEAARPLMEANGMLRLKTE